MKQFFKTIALFFIPILVITIAFEIYLRSMYTDYREKKEGLIVNYDSIEILVLGNSHTYNGIDPREFELETYNMAASNQSLYFDKRITLKHIKKLKKLKYVLISIDQHSLYFSSQGIRDTWLYYDYGIKYKNKSEFWNDLSRFWFGYTPRISVSILKDKFQNYYNGKPLDNEIIKGFMPHYESEVNAFEMSNIKSKADYFNREDKKSNERDEIIDDLEDFIFKLKEKNIVPIIITLPMYEKVYDHLNKEYMNQNNKDILNLIEKNNLHYINFSNQGKDKSLFFNSDHLNIKGAKLFSKKIDSIILSINKKEP